jgi:RNA-directed DNA polymerase
LSRRDNRTRGEGRAAASSVRHVQGRAGECHIVARTAEQDKVRELQRALYRAAKADPGRRFHALYDKVSRRDVLERAWELVRANKGAAGIDRQTIADVEQYGVSRLLDELAAELREGRWRPLPARRVFIEKPGREELRPLSIPAVRDRVVGAAVKLVIEPVFEADFLPCSFGFRPKRSAHDALQVLIDQSWRGRRWVLETDIANCFEAIPHSGLMSAIEERVSDRHLLKLLRAMLRAGVMQDGAVRRDVSGTPQGGVLSPVLCNVYLHRLDRQWAKRGTGVLVRYADDLVVLCHSKREAEAALVSLRSILAELGLELKPAKTRIVHLREGGEGLDFLGFHHRRVRGERGYRHLRFLARWPSREAMQRARDRIREITDSKRLRDPVEVIVQDLNRFLRGWANYFRYGNSRLHFTRITTYALRRLALFVAKRHKRASGYGMTVVAYVSSNRMGLVNLDRLVVTPSPFRDWRAKPNTAGEGRR